MPCIMCHFHVPIFRFLNPFGMFLGGAVVALVFMGSVWAGENKATIKNFKRKNPTLFVIGVMVTSYFVLSLCGGVMIFIFGITFPLLCKSQCISQDFMFTFKKVTENSLKKTTTLCCVINLSIYNIKCTIFTVPHFILGSAF